MKNKKLSIRISDADWQRFHEKAEQANMTLTEYITDCCLGKRIVVIDGLDEVIRQQKAIGRNLNQLTTLANMGKSNLTGAGTDEAYFEEAVLDFDDPQPDLGGLGTGTAYLAADLSNIVDHKPVEDSTTKHFRPERKKHHGPTMGGI